MVDLSVFGRLQSISDIQRQKQAMALRQQQAMRANQPAAIQIAKEIERRIAAGDVAGAQLIADSAKMYDKGMLADFGVIQPAQQATIQSAPPAQGNMTPEQAQQIKELYGQGNMPTQQTTGGITLRPGYAESKARLEAAVRGSGRQAEKNIDVVMNPEIKRAETLAALAAEANAKPSVIAAEETAKRTQAKISELPSVREGVSGAAESFAGIDMELENAKRLSSAYTTGLLGAIGQIAPGSPGYDLSASLERILANSGFDRLQQMREQSKTGGALGNVTEVELGLLQAAEGQLRQSQSQEQFERNLNAYQQHRRRSWQRIKEAYIKDYGTLDGFEPPPDINFPGGVLPNPMISQPVRLIGASDEMPDYKSKYGLE